MRLVYLQEVWREQNWHFKIYYLPRQSADKLDDQLIKTIKAKCRTIVTHYSTHADSYGVGYVIFNEEATHSYLTLSWWANESRLFQFGLIAQLNRPYRFRNYSLRGLTAGIWENLVHYHKGRAWVKHILQKPLTYNFEDYLADIYTNENQ